MRKGDDGGEKKQAGAVLGQAQLKLGFDLIQFIYIYIKHRVMHS